MNLKWTCEECGRTGPFDEAAMWNPHDCKSRGPFDEVSRLSIDTLDTGGSEQVHVDA